MDFHFYTKKSLNWNCTGKLLIFFPFEKDEVPESHMELFPETGNPDFIHWTIIRGRLERKLLMIFLRENVYGLACKVFGK